MITSYTCPNYIRPTSLAVNLGADFFAATVAGIIEFSRFAYMATPIFKYLGEHGRNSSHSTCLDGAPQRSRFK
jgi:hypothetical protein